MPQAKFVRSHFVNATPNTGLAGNVAWMFKLIYEFWGFCVNGGDDLVAPGGFATSQATGSYLSMSLGFESGSTVLLGSGSDGSTTQGSPYFTAASSSFPTGSAGKWLVTWQSGSTSTDDSIYYIKELLNTSTLWIDPVTGGTPPSQGSAPQLTTRSNINYRIIDFLATAQLSGITSGQYMVLQFNGAADINPGQRLSQFKLQGDNARAVNSNVGVTLSPSGSWDGTHFVSESYTTIYGDGVIPGGPSHSSDWFINSSAGTGYVTLVGTKDALIVFAGGGSWSYDNNNTNNPYGSMLHVEVPKRLYPQVNDPNPIAASNLGCIPIEAIGINNDYGSWWFPSPYDATVRRWPLLVPVPTGAYWNSNFWGSTNCLNGGVVTRWPLNNNQQQKTFWLTSALFSLANCSSTTVTVAGQWSLARAQLRCARFTPSGYDYNLMFGSVTSDQWIHVGRGVWWPWDGAALPSRLLRGQ